MINATMRLYDYYLYNEKDSYGQAQLTPTAQGSIPISIHITSQSIQDNINYTGANYIGLTMAAIDDSFVIQYGTEKLKVLYINPMGRYKQVFLGRYE